MPFLHRRLTSPILKLFSSSPRVRHTITTMAGLEALNFDNLALRALPVDPIKENYTRQVPNACFSLVEPSPVKNPKVVAYSAEALKHLDIKEEERKRGDFAQYFGGNVILPGARPAAHCYCGHQFGYFSGQLGDGATMYLGEIVNKKGERWELQFKGAGKTPYSRGSDGRKVLRSSIREFLCSEVNHNLGIPTTRAGTCVTSDSRVTRDLFYTGDNIQERITIITRIAPTFIRFGSFEIFKGLDNQTGRKGPSAGKNDILLKLTNYVIENFYPEVWAADGGQEAKVLNFYREVVRRTAILVARWQCVGFCHGVLNTDNMSIVGLTIDYGPYGYMDRYDPNFICNASDDGGRYTYAKQPEICRWNCGKLAEMLAPMVPLNKLREVLEEFDGHFEQEYMRLMRQKFGLFQNQPEDKKLVEDFMETMYQTGADFTNCFRALSKFHSQEDVRPVVEYLLDQCCSATEYKAAFAPQMDPRQLEMLMMLSQQNPDLLTMLGKKAGALERELEMAARQGDMKDLDNEKKRKNDVKSWTEWLSAYNQRLKTEFAGQNADEIRKRRVEAMDAANPRIVLRNFIAQNAIEAAEKGNFSEVRRVLKAFQKPFDASVKYEDLTGFDSAVEGTQGGDVQQLDEDARRNNPTDKTDEAPSCSTATDHCHIVYDQRPSGVKKIKVS